MGNITGSCYDLLDIFVSDLSVSGSFGINACSYDLRWAR
jgi:hypothetical protein